MKLRDALVKIFGELSAKAIGAGHRTGWFNAAGTEDGAPNDVFIFFTTDVENSAKARTALNAAGCLCNTDLGASEPIETDK